MRLPLIFSKARGRKGVSPGRPGNCSNPGGATALTRALAVAALLAGAPGCAESMIQSQAGYDLGCNQVHVTQISDSVYVAHGCGSSARYLVDSQGGILGPTDMHSDDETPPPGPPLPAPAALLKPPSGAGGFAFGASEGDVRRTCEQAENAYATQAGGHGSCDGVAADVGAPASARMTYCHGQSITLSAGADDKRTPSLDIAYTAPASTPRGAPGL